MDLKDILAALEGRPVGGVRGDLSEGGEAYRRLEPHRRTFLRLFSDLWDLGKSVPHRRTFLRLFSDPWIRPPGLLSSSASPFDMLLLCAERELGKSVDDFGIVEWRAVAMFLGSVIDNPRKRGRGRPRKPFREDLVPQKPRGRPVKSDESVRWRIVQEVERIKSELPGRPTDKAAIAELFKRAAALEGRRPSAYAKATANLIRRLPEWRRLPRK
jgi:hypothetical protein